MADRVLWAGLHLLDHQLLDKNGAFCGNVDDLEIARGRGQKWFVTAIHAGPGALATRLGHTTFGAWIERVHEHVDADVTRPISFKLVRKITSAIELDATSDGLPASATQRWVRDHIIGRIPGARRADK